MVIAVKLEEPLGAALEEAKPRRAESWRSELSLADIRANLETARALYDSPGGFGDALGGTRPTRTSWTARSGRASSGRFAQLDAIEPPLPAAVEDRAARAQGRGAGEPSSRACATWWRRSWRRRSTSLIGFNAHGRGLRDEMDQARLRTRTRAPRLPARPRRQRCWSASGCGRRRRAAAPGRSTSAAGPTTEGRYFTSGFRADGRTVFDVELPGRGHAQLPAGDRALRRLRAAPGPLRRRARCRARALRCTGIDAAPGRHFYGHGPSRRMAASC